MTTATLPGFSVIVVAYNSGEALRLCLQSLRHALRGVDHEVIVVDNDSAPGTLLGAPEEFSEAIWISSEVNLGFGRACNLAAERARYPVLFFVNPDTLCTRETFLSTLQVLLKKEDSGIVGCRILNSDGSLQLACRRSFPDVWSAFCRVAGLSALFPKNRHFGRYNLTYLDSAQEAEVDAVSGSFFSIRKEHFDRVGGFDRDFFMYGEDLDLCYRVQALGLRNYYTPSASLVHLKGRSTATRRWRSLIDFHKAMLIFAKKHPDLVRAPMLVVRIGILFAFFLALLRSVRVSGFTPADLFFPTLFALGAYLLGSSGSIFGVVLLWPLVKGLFFWGRSRSRFFLARRRKSIALQRKIGEEIWWDSLHPARDLLGVLSADGAGIAPWRDLSALCRRLRIQELFLRPDLEGWWLGEECRHAVQESGVPLRLLFEGEVIDLSLHSSF